MKPELLLLIHNIGHVTSAVISLFIIIVLFLRKDKSRPLKAFIFGLIWALVFTVSHVIGVNIKDSHVSGVVLMFNLSNLMTATFLAHGVLGFINENKFLKQIIFFYGFAFILLLIYIVFPGTYLQESVPKLYFPNYYVAGSLRWITTVFFDLALPIYCTIQLIIAGKRAKDPTSRNGMYYLGATLFIGYFFSNLSNPLVYDILIDPIYSILYVPFYVLPLIYAIYQYQLFDIKVVAKRALIFTIEVSAMSVFFTLLSFLNQLVVERFPFVPVWGVPLISSVAVVFIGIFVWKRVRESDMLKYEFITIITHKFRTPLTRIKYAVAEIKTASAAGQKNMEIEEIEHSASVLVDLTGELVSLTESEDQTHAFNPQNIVMRTFVDSLVPFYVDRITNKKINFSIEDTSENATAIIDTTYIKSVMQVLLENATTYTPVGGKVVVRIMANSKTVEVEVRDSGIGIPKGELNLVFGKFFRGQESIKVDTEGMGIGLFIAKSIVERHKGKIWATSEGVGKGSSFFVSLPKGK